MENLRILGIETSCDETGVAVYDQNEGLLSNEVYSQNAIHSDYGGVVPELAARDHIRKIVPVILSALKQSNCRLDHIDGIAYTAGPGLVGSLLVGAAVARTLAYVWKIPAIDIHHMEAHLLAPMIKLNGECFPTLLEFPFVALLVSGGHTLLVLAKSLGEYKILGESVDDAVGEVFDKIAVLLGLKYPGGALLSKMARFGTLGNYKFPRPMINQPNLNFSFSGLKTAVARTIISSPNDLKTRANIACEFENAIIETLTIKCRRALEKTGLQRLVISGGVSANYVLRLSLKKMIRVYKGQLFYPKLELCTDNGAMVAHAGLIRFKSGLCNNLSIAVRSRWSLEKIQKITN